MTWSEWWASSIYSRDHCAVIICFILRSLEMLTAMVPPKTKFHPIRPKHFLPANQTLMQLALDSSSDKLLLPFVAQPSGVKDMTTSQAWDLPEASEADVSWKLANRPAWLDSSKSVRQMMQFSWHLGFWQSHDFFVEVGRKCMDMGLETMTLLCFFSQSKGNSILVPPQRCCHDTDWDRSILGNKSLAAAGDLIAAVRHRQILSTNYPSNSFFWTPHHLLVYLQIESHW